MIIRNRPGCPPTTQREFEQSIAVFDPWLLSVGAMDHFGSGRIELQQKRRIEQIPAASGKLSQPTGLSGYRRNRPTKKLRPLSDSAPRVRPPGGPRSAGSLEPNQTRISVMTSIMPFLWLDNNVPEAGRLLHIGVSNAKVETVSDFMATFETRRAKIPRPQWRPDLQINEAVSFFISVESQEEVDYFWNKLTADGGRQGDAAGSRTNSACPGRSCPRRSLVTSADPDRKKADRVMQAMMKMEKIVIADLDKANAG